MNERQFLTSILHEAAEHARSVFAPFRRSYSSVKPADRNQVVTDTDRNIGKLLTQRIRTTFPNDTVVEEESGVTQGKNATRIWTIDPLDGTSNFAAGLPLFGCMIGLIVNGAPVAAGIALPYFREIYTAISGDGTFRNMAERLRVTTETDLANCLISYSLDGRTDTPDVTRLEGATIAALALKTRNIRASNSCFDAIMVARGVYGAYINRSQKIWDNIPVQLIIEEAGGTVTDANGRQLRYPVVDTERSYALIGTAPQLHGEIITTVDGQIV